jgi:hypothetical protein
MLGFNQRVLRVTLINVTLSQQKLAMSTALTRQLMLAPALIFRKFVRFSKSESALSVKSSAKTAIIILG